MNDFQSLVAELKKMALSDTAGDEPRWSESRHRATFLKTTAEKYVRDNALSHPENPRFPDDADTAFRAAIERARIDLADEVMEIQRSSYRSAARYAVRIDQQNLQNPDANYAYPAWVRGALSQYDQLIPEHERLK